MLKVAVWLFLGVVAVLVALSLQPPAPTKLPPTTVELRQADVTLYPRADPDAVWHFASPVVHFDPGTSQSELLSLTDGRRTLDGETDFTVMSDRLIIDRNDNLLAERLLAELASTGECLTMLADDGTDVVIDQALGRFRVPLMRIDGPSWGSDNQWQLVDASFDLTEFTAGGPGTVTVNEFTAGMAPANGSTPCDT